MWKQLADFCGALLTDDLGKAADVLSQEPERKLESEKPHAEGDPPCGKKDGKALCSGHGPGGTCIMTEAA